MVDTASIRPRLPGDMTGCVALLGQVHEQDGYPLLWPTDPQAWLSAGNQLAAWVADQKGIVSGHVALVRPREGAAGSAWSETLRARVEDLLCVCLLFVAPQERGRGIGSRLLDIALREARVGGAHAVLEVVSLNRHAVALYRARGWREIGSVSYDWLPENARSLLFVPPDPGPW